MKYLNRMNLQKLRQSSGQYPVRELFYKVLEKIKAPYRNYPAIYEKYLPDIAEQERQSREQFDWMPLVSIVVPAYETKEVFLKQMIDSVLVQTYGNWELCIADGSESDCVQQVVSRDYGTEKRIRYRRLTENKGIAENTNQGFEMAKGAYIALLDHDDLLVSSALYEMVKRINETGADFVYSDEDKVSVDLTEYSDPHFKLDFNRELLLGVNYICHFLMVSAELAKKAGGMDGRYNGAQDHAFALCCSKYARQVEHVAKVLYHWRLHDASTAGNTGSKGYAYEAGRRAVEDFIHKEGWEGTVAMTNDLGTYRITYQVPQGLRVSIAAWGKESRRFLKIQKQILEELDGLGAKVYWCGDRELAGIGSSEAQACQEDSPGKNEGGAADVFLLLNRGAKDIRPGSICKLLGSISRPGIGAVGARTVERRRVRQCGYWKKGGTYIPRFAGLFCRFKGYYRRAVLPVETDAVGYDLTVVKRAVLEAAGEDAALVFGEHDEEMPTEDFVQWQVLCERIKAFGGRIIAEPGAELRF